jgi:hypothetical protein
MYYGTNSSVQNGARSFQSEKNNMWGTSDLIAHAYLNFLRGKRRRIRNETFFYCITVAHKKNRKMGSGLHSI